MDQVTLQATARDTKSSTKQLLRGGSVPCVVYGNKTENTLLQCSQKDVRAAYVKAGASTLVDLDVAGKKIPVLFHELAFNPVSGLFAHVDFYAVDMNKEVEASVALHFEGESPAVKDGGILVTPITHLTVRCLPKNLPHNLPVSLDVLAEMHAVITVKDVKLPQGVTVDEDADMVVATVQEPRKEEEVVVAAAPVEGEVAPAATGAPGNPEAAAPSAAKKEEKK